MGSELTNRLLSLFPSDKIEVVESRPFPERSGELSAREFSESKKLLYVCRFPGQFFKRCPGSRPGLACCNYFVLNWGLQCDMNCSYCYLQSFLNTPVLTIYSNLPDALAELREIHASSSLSKLRVGTGETVDSLSLDPLTLYSRDLIEQFREFPNWTLEFKTKSDAVEQFIDLPSPGNVTVSWSLNPQNIVASEEHGTASLENRLRAAEMCRDAGYSLAFHIDPLIWHPEWQSSYATLVAAIVNRFKPIEVNYLSTGALRFQPEQRAIMRERFGMSSHVTSGELFPSKDGKWRYDSQVRQEMFRFVMTEFQKYDSKWRLFMCMETPESWLNTTGQSPFQSNELKELFDTSVIRSVRQGQLESQQQERS